MPKPKLASLLSATRSSRPARERVTHRRSLRGLCLFAFGGLGLLGAPACGGSGAAVGASGSGNVAGASGSGTSGASGQTSGGGASGVSGGSSGASGSGTSGSAGGGAAGSDGSSGSSGTGAGGSSGTSGGSGAGGASGASGASGQAGTGGLDCPGDPYNPAAPPGVVTLTGNLGAHDPAALVVGSTVYLDATGLIAKTSTNLTNWAAGPNPLNPRPAWVAQMVPGATNLWAPDLSSFGGQFHLYYAASTFGSNRSCIGHATRPALDSGNWTDQGTTICSNMGTNDNWNAIDPNVVLDDAGTPWLAFGSFWGGLKMIRLDSTGARADTMLYSIAARPNAGGALEGAWVFKRCGYYYLFSSWGACCNGALDYNMRVGRSTSVTGPYVDKAGVALMQGGGTLLVQGNADWVAPGHNSVIAYGGKTYNIYHALQGGGRATLRIADLVWDADGWPVSGGP